MELYCHTEPPFTIITIVSFSAEEEFRDEICFNFNIDLDEVVCVKQFSFSNYFFTFEENLFID